MSKYVVRYGTMRFLGVFTPSTPRDLPRAARVIVRTDRGLEAGEVLCEATARTVGWLKDPTEGPLLRQMTTEDTHELARLQEQSRSEFQVCRRAIDSLALEMDLIDVEHLFGGERVVVYYLADGRVDFRQLVKVLAGEFQTRIEMRQIGVRDEAKLLADFGDCGKTVCCNSHLVEMPPVSMKMAKLQKATLDPTKISGRCGRLKCCLRYEFDTYEYLQKLLPPLGSYVVTAAGRAKVIGHEVLSQQLLVETEDRHRTLIDVAETTAGATQDPTPFPILPIPTMFDPVRALMELLQSDRRYRYEAYVFVFEALRYAQTVLGLGTPAESEPVARPESLPGEESGTADRHVSGQELCMAIRQFAVEQYGLMSKTVLNSWGIYETGDFGEIVFNLIRIGKMRKTRQDRREDFDDVYDFDEALRPDFKMTLPKA